MTKQTINIGRSANDKTGDPIRVAFRKVNENFTELYNAVGADVQIPSQTGNANKYLKTNGTTLSWATVAGGDANLGDITVENANTFTIEDATLGLRSFNPYGSEAKIELDAYRIRSQVSLSNSRTYNTGNSFDSAQWVAGEGSTITFTNLQQYVIDFLNTDLGNANNITVQINGVGPEYTYYYFNGTDQIYIATNPETSPVTVTEIRFSYKDTSYVNIDPDEGDLDIVGAPGVDIRITAGDDLFMTANDRVRLTAGSDLNLRSGDDYVTIVTNYDIPNATQHNWYFSNNGKLELPPGGDIVDSTGASVLGGTGGGTGDRLVNGVKEVILDSTGLATFPLFNTDPGNVFIQGPEIGSTNSPIGISTIDSVIINTNVADAAKQWTFGTDGTLTIPGEIKSAAGTGDVVIEANDGVARTWTFGGDGSLTLPQGSVIADTTTTTIISPPGALAGQSLVIRPTQTWSLTSDHPDGFTPGDSITITYTPNINGQYTFSAAYTFTGCTEEQLGRSLTGSLVYSEEETKSLTWTIPSISNITSFTFTIENVVFSESPDPFITLTSTGSVSNEPSHLHLISGNPATVDLYLGDDDQYVKIEKNGGDVVIGTDTDTKRWRFGTDGALSLPQGGSIAGGDAAAIQTAYNDWQADEAAWQALITGEGTDLNIRPWSSAGPSRAERQAVLTSMWQAQQSNEVINWVPISAAFYNQVRTWLAVTVNQDGYENWKQLTTSVNITADDKTWTFDQSGALRIPGVIMGQNDDTLLMAPQGDAARVLNYGGNQQLYVQDTGVYIQTSVDNNGAVFNQWHFGLDGRLTLPSGSTIGETAGVSANITVNGNAWAFDVDGALTFPDATVQTTAYQKVAVPAHSYGAAGDKAGMFALDSTYIYYCTADYGQTGHQVTGSDYIGRGALNTNAFQLTKTADTLQITIGDVISDSNGGATSTVVTVTSDEDYTYVSTGGLAYDCVFPLMFTSIDYVPGGDIWKRTAHGTGTW